MTDDQLKFLETHDNLEVLYRVIISHETLGVLYLVDGLSKDRRQNCYTNASGRFVDLEYQVIVTVHPSKKCMLYIHQDSILSLKIDLDQFMNVGLEI